MITEEKKKRKWSEQINMNLEQKLDNLKEYLRSLNHVVIAFSGGVDSTFLLKVAHEVLGDKVLAITAKSCLLPERELKEAEEFCKKEGIKHIVIASDELDIEGFRNNPVNRCYLCKKETFEKMIQVAEENNIKNIAEGSNMDDNGDYRPGLEAVAQLGIKSPLRHAELYKQEIRELSKRMGLPTWKKQSFACLASRFVYGEIISEEKLKMVERAEQLLLDKGFHQVRVRIHDKMARTEVGMEELEKVLENREEIIHQFKEYGFTYVTLDLTGYRTGSMNDMIK